MKTKLTLKSVVEVNRFKVGMQFIICMFVLSLTSGSFAQVSWIQKSSPDTTRRYGAVGFSLNGDGYIGLGGADGNERTLNDFAKWSDATNQWSVAAPFPGGGRLDGTAFVINGFAYAGLGTTAVNGSGATNDFWKYDPISDSWSQIQSMPVNAGRRYAAASFAIGATGYVMGGSPAGPPYLGDVWAYNSISSSWVQKNDLPIELSNVEISATFSLGNYGYIAGAGYNDGSSAHTVNQLWQYNPATDSWRNMGKLPGVSRFGASAFVLNGIPYFGLGMDSLNNNLNDFWQLDTTNFTWSSITALPAKGRIRSVAFAIGNNAYVGTGTFDFIKNVSDPPALNDFWQLHFSGCTNWTQRANIDTTRRYGAIGFSLNNNGYVGLGATDGNGNLLSDIQKWDVASNTWSPAANFPGGGRLDAISFVANGFEYAGLGTSAVNGSISNNDLWKYNAGADSWSQVSSMPGGAGNRYAASCFVVGTKAFVFGGTHAGPPYLGDVWEYDAVNDSWLQKSDLPAALSNVEVSAAFSVGNFGYIAGATYNNGSDSHNVYQLWQYNPLTDSWVEEGSLPGTRRYSCTAFVLNGIPYFGSGQDSLGADLTDFWQMDTTAFTWSPVEAFPATGSIRSVAFTIGNKAYVGTGSNNFSGNVAHPPALNDYWRFEPCDTTVVNGVKTIADNDIQFALYPNPTDKFVNIGIKGMPGKMECKIMNVLGQQLYEQQIFSSSGYLSQPINVENLTAGIYFVQVQMPDNSIQSGTFIKQ